MEISAYLNLRVSIKINKDFSVRWDKIYGRFDLKVTLYIVVLLTSFKVGHHLKMEDNFLSVIYTDFFTYDVNKAISPIQTYNVNVMVYQIQMVAHLK